MKTRVLTVDEVVAYAKSGRPILGERLPDGSVRFLAAPDDFPVTACLKAPALQTLALPAATNKPLNPDPMPRDRYGRLKRFR